MFHLLTWKVLVGEVLYVWTERTSLSVPAM